MCQYGTEMKVVVVLDGIIFCLGLGRFYPDRHLNLGNSLERRPSRISATHLDLEMPATHAKKVLSKIKKG